MTFMELYRSLYTMQLDPVIGAADSVSAQEWQRSQGSGSIMAM